MKLVSGDWLLMLNDMRSCRIEILTVAMTAQTKAELVEFVESERVEPYTDGNWGKRFRQGGPLEWFNDLEPFSGSARYRRYIAGAESEELCNFPSLYDIGTEIASGDPI